VIFDLSGALVSLCQYAKSRPVYGRLFYVCRSLGDMPTAKAGTTARLFPA